MAVSGTSALSDSVKALYQDDYLDILHMESDWPKFVKWQARFGGMDLKGSSYNFPVGFPLDRVTSAAAETSDVTPVEGKSANISVPMTELNEVRGFRLSAQCTGTLTVSFYDTDTLKYSVDISNVAYTDGYVKHSLPNGTYFADPEVRLSSSSPFTLRMFEPTVIPVRKQIGDFTRVQQTGSQG